MIAEKLWVPNMPRLEMLKLPPWNSSGLSLLALALPASSRTSSEICSTHFPK